MYTSLKFSKQLKENNCELESNHYYVTEGKNYKSCFKYDILNDICVRYAKEFFGEDYKSSVGYHGLNRMEVIMDMLQQNKSQEEIEKYIKKNCKFFN